MINIKVNGDNITIEKNMSILEYLNILKLDKDSVVVLLNDNILKKDEYNTELYENCVIEILRFVSGG